MPSLVAGYRWQVSNGYFINLWKDAWRSQSILDLVNTDGFSLHLLLLSADSLINKSSWCVFTHFATLLPQFFHEVVIAHLPINSLSNKLVWMHSCNSCLS